MTEGDSAMALKAISEFLDLLDDTEVPGPMPIETEEDRELAMGFLLWRWKNSLFE